MYVQNSQKIASKYKSLEKPGFSLIEIMICFIIIGIMVAIIAPNIGQISGSASMKAKKANVENINNILATIYAIGGKIEDGNTADIDTTSITTVIDSLSKNPPLELDGFTFSVQPKPNAEAYKLISGVRPYKVFAVNEDFKNAKP